MNAMDFANAFQRLVQPLRSRVFGMISRAVVDLVNDSKKCQTLQVEALADEILDDVEHFQPGGLTAVPLKDAECLILCVGGDRSHAIAIGVQDRTKRPKGMAAGEVALYRMDDGVKRVHLKANGEVLIGEGPTEFVALANLVKTEIEKLRDWAAAHKHEYTDDGVAAITTAPRSAVSTADPPPTVEEVAAVEVKAK